MIAQVIKMKEILEQALLYDFYGELLTKHQREIYEQFVLEDLSLSEIAVHAGISRQGVHDLVKRCQKLLKGYEEKLHLVERFLIIRGQVKEINRVLDVYDTCTKDDNKKDLKTREMMAEIRCISGRIIEEL